MLSYIKQSIISQMLKQNNKQTGYPQPLRTKTSSTSAYPKRKGNPSNIRVLRTNLVYAIGLSPQICSQSILSSQDYFGRYGKVLKVALNKKPNMDKKQLRPPSYSAVVTYDNQVSASIAVISLFEFKSSNGIIRCCYGCTKYCDIFFNGKTCNKLECPYMHEFDQEREINLTNGERYQDYDFERHFNMAADIVFDALGSITEVFNRNKLSTEVFPGPYESMKVLIESEYLSAQQYQKGWQSDQKQQQPQQRKCYTQSTAVKQDNSGSESGSVQNQQYIADLDIQQSICNKIISKIQKKNKSKSNLDFVENKPTSPRFIEQFRSFFGKRITKQI